MAFEFEAACGCLSGSSRSNNEDNFYFKNKHLRSNNRGLKNSLAYKGSTDEAVLFAVFDGMGGECKGEEASYLASKVFSQELNRNNDIAFDGKEFFLNACTKASKTICEEARKKQVGTMGTTVAALFLSQGAVYACNVGDSKIFRIRRGQMVQISEDHTDERLLSTMGVDKKPVLLQYLGIPETTMMIDPYIAKGDIQSEDYYIICSDGVTDSLSPSEIYGVVKEENKAESIVNKSMSDIVTRDGKDNATLIVVKVL